MKIVTLGGTSVSGQSFTKYVTSLQPDWNVEDITRSEIEGCAPTLASIDEIGIRLFEALQERQPSHIINFLGSISNDFSTCFRANVQIPEALLSAAVRAVPTASIVLIGSAAEYGQIKEPSQAVTEETPLHPSSVYGVTKAMQATIVPFYASRFKLNVKLARAFNILAPGLSANLFVGKVYEQIAKIRRGELKHLEVGPLLDKRDYISADLAAGDYLRILMQGSPGQVYNVCSGFPVTMAELLQQILKEESLENVRIVIDASIPRSPVPCIFGSRQKVDALP
jgi:nucleoside-diphosphate-sugar epimerase